MTIDQKMEYEIDRVMAEISAWLSGKTDKYEYLLDEEILPSQQLRIMQEAKFSYWLLEKALEKQTRTIDKYGKKQVENLLYLVLHNQQIHPYQTRTKSIEDIFSNV